MTPITLVSILNLFETLVFEKPERFRLSQTTKTLLAFYFLRFFWIIIKNVNILEFYYDKLQWQNREMQRLVSRSIGSFKLKSHNLSSRHVLRILFLIAKCGEIRDKKPNGKYVTRNCTSIEIETSFYIKAK